MERFAGTSVTASARRAVEAGRQAFGPAWAPERLAVAPGRIELLGNHLDYNGGPVLAAAIDRFIAIASASDSGPRDHLRAVAADVPGDNTASFDAAELAGWRNSDPSPAWTDYVRGLLAALHGSGAANFARLPTSLAIAGDVPIGFGVSSSAALCVALTLSLVEMPTSRHDVVLLAQEAEHRAGTPCGTMDQSTSLAGGVIAFDGSTLTVEELTPSLNELVFVVADSGVERSLGASSYPTRVTESEAALALARRVLGAEIPHLAALTGEQWHELRRQHLLPETLAKRTRHIVEETDRVRQGREAMANGDWPRFGQLMTASGRSSATLYEISHPQVEELVAESLRVEGVLGARMMGGGEGGSVLILLPRAEAARLEKALRSNFYTRHGMERRAGLIHACAFSPGATVFDGSALADLC